MQERKQYKISLPMTEKQKNKVEELLKFASFDGTPFRLEEIEKSEEVHEEKEWPQNGDNYYFIVSEGLIDDAYFNTDGIISEHRLAIGNCFKTKEEAEFELERLKVIAKMKKFAEPKNREWDGINMHWSIHSEMPIKIIFYANFNYRIANDIYFESREKAEECLKTIGKDKIMKYYLRIKE